MNIFEKLREYGYDTLPEDYYRLVRIWRSWYDGDVKSFHTYKVYNGQKTVKVHRNTLGMGKKVCEDWANLLMNERVHITLEGEKEQQFFDDVCLKNNFEEKANEMQELKTALGSCAYVLRVSGMSVTSNGDVTGAEEIKIDYVTGENIFPLSWENGKVLDCAFACDKTYSGKKYLYLRVDKRDSNGLYEIHNLLFEQRNGSLSSELALDTIPELANVPPVIRTGSDVPQFVIDKPNIANNVDVSYPLSVAVFANAIDELKGTDVAFDSYVNEFILGKKRIMVKPEAMKNPMTDEPYFDTNDVCFYVLPEDGADSSIKEIDMALRTTEHNTGIQDMLNLLSMKCGFGEKYYKFDGSSVATATQVVSDNSVLFRTIKKHEIILERVLKELTKLILHLGNIYMNAGLNEEVEISIDFDDSIIEDKNAEFERDSRFVSMGVMALDEFRAKWMNEDIETARAALPKMESLISE